MNGVVGDEQSAGIGRARQDDKVFSELNAFDRSKNHRLTRSTEVERESMSLLRPIFVSLKGERVLRDQAREGVFKGSGFHGSNGRRRGPPRQVSLALSLLLVLVTACASRDVRVARRAMARGDFDSAVEGYRRAAEAEPEEPSRWLDLARAELMADRPAEARSAFARLAALRPADPHPIVEMGFTHELERNYERALQSYVRAVEVAPESAYPHRVMGTRLLRWGQHAEALAPLEEAFAREPSHAETAKALALTQHAGGDSDAAVRTYRAGLAASPGDLGLRLGLAAMLISVSELADALEVYEDLCEDIPGFAAAHAGRGILLHELGRMDEAEAAFVRAAEVAPEPDEYEARLVAYRELRAEAEREPSAPR